MILGMSISTFTLLHLLIAVAGIASGFVVVSGMLRDRHRRGWATIFILSSMLTSLTGFLFPIIRLMPSHTLGLLSLSVITLAIFARAAFRLEGPWRGVYVVSISAALYFTCVAAVTQAFAKISVLRNVAPAGGQPFSLITQGAVLIAFIVLTALAARRFHAPPLDSV